MVRVEEELDSALHTVSLLADDDLGNVLEFGLLVVLDLPVEEQNDVGVLLDASGFAKVAQLGPLVLAPVDLAAELRTDNDRNA